MKPPLPWIQTEKAIQISMEVANSIISLTNNLNIINGNNINNNVSKIATKGIKLKLDSIYNELNLSYTITPNIDIQQNYIMLKYLQIQMVIILLVH